MEKIRIRKKIKRGIKKIKRNKNKNKIDILTIGDASIDEFLEIEDAHLYCKINKQDCEISFKYGDKIPVEKFDRYVAGNSINVAIGTKKLGLNSAVYSEIGDDTNAELIIKKLKEFNINTNFINKNPNTNTNIHPIIVHKGERTIFSYHRKQTYTLKKWTTPKIVYYTSLSKGFETFQNKLINYLKENENVIFAINPGSTMLKTNIEAIRKTFERLDILFVNKDEAEKLAQTSGKIKATHEKLAKMGVKMSVITNNVQGSSVFDGNKFYKLGVCNLGNKVDATGAGDSYASGFISAIAKGKPSPTAMKWGSINAASVITKIGSINGLLNSKKIQNLAKTLDFSKPSIQ